MTYTFVEKIYKRIGHSISLSEDIVYSIITAYAYNLCQNIQLKNAVA